jgi:hypothetical protein
LTAAEQQEANDHGKTLFYEAERRKRKDSVNAKNDELGMAKHRVGAASELAYSIFFGVPWPKHVETYKRQPDFPPDIEVRCRVGWKNIIVRPDDVPDRRYVCVNFEDDHFVFYGWIWGYEAKRHPLIDVGGYGRPAHIIDIKHLHRFPTLTKMHKEVKA